MTDKTPAPPSDLTPDAIKEAARVAAQFERERRKRPGLFRLLEKLGEAWRRVSKG